MALIFMAALLVKHSFVSLSDLLPFVRPLLTPAFPCPAHFSLSALTR